MKPTAETILPADPPINERARRIARPPTRYNPAPTAVRRIAVGFWLNYCFWHAERFPRLTRWSKWFYLIPALTFSKTMQLSTAANARRIFGDSITTSECRRFRYAVVSYFFDFVADIAASVRLSRAQLLARIKKIHGEEKYDAARQSHRGAIIATMHMGSFEVATAALHLREKNIHIVFKKDIVGRFEHLRTRARKNLAVTEAPIDEGWMIWLRLREALAQDEVVMVQADRVMPGQKGLRMKFLHGHLLMPTGPVRLAMVTGSPIIPIISTRTPKGLVEIHIEDAIYFDSTEGIDEPMRKLRDIVEKYVREYPTQWLMLEPAFCEDQP